MRRAIAAKALWRRFPEKSRKGTIALGSYEHEKGVAYLPESTASHLIVISTEGRDLKLASGYTLT
ncbi:MAG: hypothetical protein GWP08_11855 [Nitrospiraceae bacterium]|nr:hypothetical protein [Nitrospiraceae bacterium]